MEKILVCDDDPKIVQIITAYLIKEGYRIDTASDGEDCLAKINRDNFSLIILDVMMPKLDGFETCKRLRRQMKIPIILLTARVEESDKVLGLELGADDYVVKPFSPRELMARVKAHLRRCRGEVDSENRQVYKYEELIINPRERRVLVSGREAILTVKEFDLLACMAKHPGRVYSRDMLYELIWGNDSFGDVRTVDVHVTRLRNKIENMGSYQYINTVWGIGYRFEPLKK